MINIKFDLSIMQNYPADDWGQAQNNPQDYYKSYFMVVGLRIQNKVVKRVEWCPCGYHPKDDRFRCDL